MKYNELLKQRDELDAQISEAKRAESVEAIDTVRRLIADYALTAKDCGFSDAKPKAMVTQSKRGPAPVKYRGPNGETWSGRGRAPGWIRAAEQIGGSRKTFMVTQEAA
ncbi:MAG: H-NS histone family protein [Candidatus Accumulibacter sp.]|uniref:H-NS histone family protein n=1 Tax=Accumulibacter sp. TaxID=2053492 RepID=UPI00258F8CC3|nr:H-NS histone family protein [Accumulibacter sp.]MBK8113449.1 H-NS histone family protein [Accumulibacter sp.]